MSCLAVGITEKSAENLDGMHCGAARLTATVDRRPPTADHGPCGAARLTMFFFYGWFTSIKCDVRYLRSAVSRQPSALVRQNVTPAVSCNTRAFGNL